MLLQAILVDEVVGLKMLKFGPLDAIVGHYTDYTLAR